MNLRGYLLFVRNPLGHRRRGNEVLPTASSPYEEMRGDLAAGMGKTPHRNLGLSMGAFIVRWHTFLQWTSPVLPPLRMSPDACFSIAATKSGSITHHRQFPVAASRGKAGHRLTTLENAAFASVNASKPLERTAAVFVVARNALVAVRISELYLQPFALSTNMQLDALLVL